MKRRLRMPPQRRFHRAMLSRRHLLAAPALVLPARAQAAARVALLHMNDFHSRHLPVAANGTDCRAGQECFGGSARLAGAIAAARGAIAADGRAHALLDAGDQFMGSLFYSHHRGLAEAAVQNALGCTAMALGNHEFDHGPEVLARYAAAVPFRLLAANLDTSAEPLLHGRIAAAHELRLDGARIVLVGLITPDTPNIASPGPRLRFLDAEDAADRAVWTARREGPCTVVVLSHLGLGADRRLADAVRGIDVIVGGHSHTLLGNGLAGAAAPYPVEQRGALIVQAGAHGRWVGRLDLDIGTDGRVQAHGGNTRAVDVSVTEDAAVAALVARLAAPLEELRRRPVATLPLALDNAGCHVAPCEIGALVADALRRSVPDAEIGWMNAGGIRAGLPAGTVTWGDVLTTLPFQNSVSRMVLRGGALLEALENGVSRLPGGAGRFPQLAGLRFRVVAPGRVAEVEVLRDGRWEALDPARAYVVATNNFLRGGGDGYAMFRDAALEAYDGGVSLDEAVVAALAR